MTARTGVVFCAALLAYLLSSGFGHTVYDNYVLLANALLHGRVWIDQPPPAIDALHYGSHWYIVEGPFPAVLMLPFVLLWGELANQSFVCVLCGAVSVAAADVLLRRMALPGRIVWLILSFFAFGTALWWCTAFGAVWMFAHVSAFMFAVLALAELYGARRPWLVGLLLACAALSRFPLILAALPIGVWLTFESAPSKRARRLASFGAGFVPLFALYAAYNYLRWGSVFDAGYTLWFHQDQVGSPTGLPFRLSYLPFNLYSFFLLSPPYDPTWPWLRPTGLGVALTFTSPALALLFAARRSLETAALWTAVVLTALPSLLYYVNGFEQFGMRHSLDFLPFAIPLAARGALRCPPALVYALVALSIAFNAFGLWYSWSYHAYSVVPR